MSEPAENAHQSPLAGQLSEAQGLVEAGNFKDALSLLKQVKALDPRNIYVLAFEKQVEQLVEFSDMNILTDEQKTDILESIPGIIQRALEASSGDAAEELAEKQQELDREREERAAALEWLKNQYFQHAHEYVRKGEYTHALAEIRRVYIIDPSNRIAEDFEHQIEQLIALRKVQTMPRMQPRPAFAPSTGPAAERQAVVLPARVQVRPEPAPRPVAQAHVSEPEAGTPQKRRSYSIIIGIALSVIVVLLAAYYFFGRRPSAPPTIPEEPASSEAIPPTEGSYAPVEPSKEQGFIVSLSEKNGNISARVRPETADAGTVSFDDGSSEPEPPSRETRPSRASEQKNRSKSSQGRVSANTDRFSTAGPGGLASATDEPSASPASNPAGSVTEEARVIRLERPQFAGGTKTEGLEGQVVVRVEIDREGLPRQTNILRSTNSLLDAPVIAAINRSTFTPRRTSAGPVNSWMTIPFTFRASKQ